MKTDNPQDRLALFSNAAGAVKLVAWTSAKAGGSPDETMEHAVVVRTADSLPGAGMLGDAAKIPQGFGLWLAGAPQYVAIPKGVGLIESVSVGRAMFPVLPGGGAVQGAPAVVEGKALDLCRAEAGWKFIPNTGKGAVSVGRAADGKDAVFIDWDFSQSKSKSTPYVMTSVPIAGVDGAGSIDFLAKSPIAQNLTVRVIDATGQTLQFRCRVKGTGAWEKMTFPLGRKLEHWDGANDGFAHFPLKTFNVNVPKPGDAVSGRVELCDFATTAGAARPAAASSAAPAAAQTTPKAAPALKAAKPPKAQALAEARNLGLFDGGAEWKFIPNTGKGSFELREVEGAKVGAVKWDFSSSRAKGVPYVLSSVSVAVEAGQFLTFQACGTVPQKLTFRVTDATGQTLQFKTKIQGNGSWETINFPLGKKLEHWDGANDGFTHFPLQGFCISIPKPADVASGETLFSKKDYKNFVLDLAYVMDPTANSGVFLYDTDHPKYKFEVQILDDHHPCYSNEVPYQLTGAIYGRCAPRKVASKPAGELNRMTCWCEGSRVRVVVNGEEVVDADLTDWKDPLVNPDGTTVPKWHKGFPALGTIPMHGRIALQGIHGGKAVRFKYLKVKEL